MIGFPLCPNDLTQRGADLGTVPALLARHQVDRYLAPVADLQLRSMLAGPNLAQVRSRTSRSGTGGGVAETDELQLVVGKAQVLLDLGQVAAAERVLLRSARLADRSPGDPAAVGVYLLLAVCAQADDRLNDAFQFNRRARAIADEAGMVDLGVTATNGMAHVLVRSGQVDEAIRLSMQLVNVCRQRGRACGAALSVAGDVLDAAGLDGAIEHYTEALIQPDIGLLRGQTLANLGWTLHRQNRSDEASARLYEAAECHLADGQPDAACKVLLELAQVSETERTRAFVRAHELMVALHENLDTGFYESFPERWQGIEAELRQRVPEERVVELRTAIHQRLSAGLALLQQQRIADAEAQFRGAEEAQRELGFIHDLPQIWFARSHLESLRGDYQRSVEFLDFSAALFANVGDAVGEVSALYSRCAYTEPTDSQQLTRLTRALVLLPFAGEAVAGACFAKINDMLEQVCVAYGADELAARYGDFADEAAAANDPGLKDEKALLKLFDDPDREGELTAALERVRDGTSNVQERYLASQTLGARRFEDGVFTEETLTYLRDACAAYEEIRRDKGETEHSNLYTRSGLPPYARLAEVALHLGRVAEAFDALERIKSRSLLDALRVTPPDDEDPEEAALWQELLNVTQRVDEGERAKVLRAELRARWQTNPRLRAHRLAEPITAAELPAYLGDAILVELFVGTHAVHGFVADGDRLTVSTLDVTPAQVAKPVDVLTHPGYLTIVDWLDQIAAGRPLYVVPHKQLHHLPLHLTAQARPRPGTHLLPSASLLRYATPSWRPGDVIVGADPLGDLPFARMEGALVAATHGVRCHTDVTADWLARSLAAARTPVVHLACHATFNERRPDRSGLLLARTNGGIDLVTPHRLSTMDWTGAVVLLGACESGAHRIDPGDELAGLGRALLAAGAAATIVTLRQVNDFASALLLTWLHEELAATAAPVRMGTVLATVQERLRTATARDMIGWADANPSPLAAKVIANAHAQAGNLEALQAWQERRHLVLSEVDGPAYDVRPFAAPDHWAWFFVLGA